MLTLQVGLHWVAVTFYVLGTIFFVIGTFWDKGKWSGRGIWLAGFGLVPHGFALAVRWVITGRVPCLGRFEAYSSMVWVSLFIYFLLRRKYKALDIAGVVILPANLLVLAMVLMSSPAMRETPSSFKTYWLVIHILFAKLTYGFNLFGAIFGGLYLWKEKKQIEKGLPSSEELDEWSYFCIATGFIFLTIMIISGSIWANSAWGSYWSWDPVETWSLMAWLVYGIYLHLRRTLHWRGRALTWVGLVAFFLTLIAVFGLAFLDAGMHSNYLADIRMKEGMICLVARFY